MQDIVIRAGKKDFWAYSHRTTDGYTFNSHMHVCYEFLYITEGHFLYTVEGTDYSLSPGDMIVTAPNELHSFSFPEKCRYQRQFLHIYPRLIENFPEQAHQLLLRPHGKGNLIPAVLVDKYKIPYIFSELDDYCTHKPPETDVMVLTFALQLIVKYTSILRNEIILDNKIRLNSNTERIREYVGRHFTSPMTLDEIADYMFLDKSYICRLFKHETGMTLKNYINLRRIILAKNLIQAGGKPTAVYNECGFDNYSTFWRCFQKYAGSTPEQFQRTCVVPKQSSAAQAK